MERACDGLAGRRSFATGGVEVGREGRPTRGAEQRIEVLGGHGATVVSGSRQGVRLKQVTVRLDLPQDALRIGDSTVAPAPRWSANSAILPVIRSTQRPRPNDVEEPCN